MPRKAAYSIFLIIFLSLFFLCKEPKINGCEQVHCGPQEFSMFSYTWRCEFRVNHGFSGKMGTKTLASWFFGKYAYKLASLQVSKFRILSGSSHRKADILAVMFRFRYLNLFYRIEDIENVWPMSGRIFGLFRLILYFLLDIILMVQMARRHSSQWKLYIQVLNLCDSPALLIKAWISSTDWIPFCSTFQVIGWSFQAICFSLGEADYRTCLLTCFRCSPFGIL